MRIEHIIAAVTRPVVIATVREIKAAVLFVGTACLHLWLTRMPLGMLPYSVAPANHSSPFGGGMGRGDTGKRGRKPGRLQLQPLLALASCPAGRAQA